MTPARVAQANADGTVLELAGRRLTTVPAGTERFLCWSQTLTEPLYADRFGVLVPIVIGCGSLSLGFILAGSAGIDGEAGELPCRHLVAPEPPPDLLRAAEAAASAGVCARSNVNALMSASPRPVRSPRRCLNRRRSGRCCRRWPSARPPARRRRGGGTGAANPSFAHGRGGTLRLARLAVFAAERGRLHLPDPSRKGVFPAPFFDSDRITGIDPNRVSHVSFGEERPFAHGMSEEAWQQNRRAHLRIEQ